MRYRHAVALLITAVRCGAHAVEQRKAMDAQIQMSEPPTPMRSRMPIAREPLGGGGGGWVAISDKAGGGGGGNGNERGGGLGRGSLGGAVGEGGGAEGGGGRAS